MREELIIALFVALIAGCSSQHEPAEPEPPAVVEAPPPAESPAPPPAESPAPPSDEDTSPASAVGADPLFVRLSGHWTGRDVARGEEYHLNVSEVRGCFVGTLSILTPASVVCVVEAACEDHGENEVWIEGPCLGDEGPMQPVGCSLSLNSEGRMLGSGCFEVALERVP